MHKGQTLKELVIASLERELNASGAVEEPAASYWAKRKLLPAYEDALKAGAFSGGTDSSQIISQERD